MPGGYLTSPTGSSVHLMGSPTNHNGSHGGMMGGSPGNSHGHLQSGLQDPQVVAMQMAGGSSSGLMAAPSYVDGGGGELTELKKRR